MASKWNDPSKRKALREGCNIHTKIEKENKAELILVFNI